MSFLKCLVLVMQFYYLFDLSIAQPKFRAHDCTNDTEFSPNSTYGTNLNAILSSVSRKIDDFGFYNSSLGLNSDTISVIAQCRGDVQLQVCRDCINDAARKILEECPYKKSAFGYYDRCLLRYSNESIMGNSATRPQKTSYHTGNNASSPEVYFQDLRNLLGSLRDQASRGGKKKYASNSTQGPDFQTIYALVQCTADLSAQSCINCLNAGILNLPRSDYYGKQDLGYFMPSCSFQYDTNNQFFDKLPTQAPPPLSPPSPPSPLSPPPSGKDDKTTRTIIIIVVPTITVMLIICISVILMRRRRRKLVNDIQSKKYIINSQ